jgi:hypothetical protein
MTPYTGHELHGTVSRIWLAGLPAGPDDRSGQLTRPPGRRE